jgi:hypothetical protein
MKALMKLTTAIVISAILINIQTELSAQSTKTSKGRKYFHSYFIAYTSIESASKKASVPSDHTTVKNNAFAADTKDVIEEVLQTEAWMTDFNSQEVDLTVEEWMTDASSFSSVEEEQEMNYEAWMSDFSL